MAAKILPDQAYLLQRLDYDPITGTLIWRERPAWEFAVPRTCGTWNTRYAGTRAGFIDFNGYLRIKIHQSSYLASRVIFKMMTGEEPPEVIDHENTVRSDNTWDNIRPATHQKNAMNRRNRSDSPYGLKGVHRHKARGKPAVIRARIWVNDKAIHLGTFDTPEEAHAAYCAAARTHFGEFWNPG